MIHIPGDAVAPLTIPELRRAVETLARALSERAAGHGLATAEARRWLFLLAAALEEKGEMPNAAALTVAEVAGLSRMLEQLRAAVIDHWSQDESTSDPAGVLRLLQAMERVRRSLQEEPTRDSFAALFSSMRGPEILVELAHDLRSPLTSILFLSETLRRGQSGELNELQSRQLAIIYSAALNLVSLAGDVIELARGGFRPMETHPTPFSVAQVLESVGDVVRPMAEHRGVALRLLPPRTDQRIGFPVALNRVILNLTTNALMATEEGFVEVTAEEGPGDQIEFSVRDTGRGIDEEAIEHLFEPFRSGRFRDRVGFSGTGLGLAISKKLVAAMDGDLHFDTRSDWGTRFYFQIPLPRANLR